MAARPVMGSRADRYALWPSGAPDWAMSGHEGRERRCFRVSNRRFGADFGVLRRADEVRTPPAMRHSGAQLDVCAGPIRAQPTRGSPRRSRRATRPVYKKSSESNTALLARRATGRLRESNVAHGRHLPASWHCSPGGNSSGLTFALRFSPQRAVDLKRNCGLAGKAGGSPPPTPA